ncbi:MAG: hypothetical protein H6819_12440 [Phycisphaerales bacterium]|nr:hypothetical protein [Phycisphaerales bacterium]MCB9855195.1 hypothetical protein [Phycisphaerales bacterium]MCB9862788.1 hypothetical protein [Phycisphaerales bacterium]
MSYKRRICDVACILTICAMSLAEARGAENEIQTDFYPIQDAMIEAVNSTTNYGASSTITIGTQSTTKAGPVYIYRGLWQYQVNGIPSDHVITKVEQILEGRAVAAPGGQSVSFRRLTQTDWREEYVTWLKWGSGASATWTNPGGDYSSRVVSYPMPASITTTAFDISDLWNDLNEFAGATVQVDLLAKQAANEGVTDGRFTSVSSESTPQPILRVTHIPVGSCIPNERWPIIDAQKLSDPHGVDYVDEIESYMTTPNAGADRLRHNEPNNWMAMAGVAYKSCQHAFFTKLEADYRQANIDLIAAANQWPMDDGDPPLVIVSESGKGTSLNADVTTNRQQMLGASQMRAYHLCVAYSILVHEGKLSGAAAEAMNTKVFDRLLASFVRPDVEDTIKGGQTGNAILLYSAILQCQGNASGAVDVMLDGYEPEVCVDPVVCWPVLPNGTLHNRCISRDLGRGIPDLLDEEEDDGLWKFDGNNIWYWALSSDQAVIMCGRQIYDLLSPDQQAALERCYQRPLKMICKSGSHPYIRSIYPGQKWRNWCGLWASRYWGPDENTYDVKWALRQMFESNLEYTGQRYLTFLDLSVAFDPSETLDALPSVSVPAGDRRFSDRIFIRECPTFSAVRQYKDHVRFAGLDGTFHSTPRTGFGIELISEDEERLFIQAPVGVSCLPDICEIGLPLKQYANQLIYFSSQDAPNYRAEQVLGAPEPNQIDCGCDTSNAWRSDGTLAEDTLEVGFETPVLASGVVITRNTGGWDGGHTYFGPRDRTINRVEVREVTGVLRTVFIAEEAEIPPSHYASRWVEPTTCDVEINWPLTDLLVDGVRITFNTLTHSGVEACDPCPGSCQRIEIDAVELQGIDLNPAFDADEDGKLDSGNYDCTGACCLAYEICEALTNGSCTDDLCPDNPACTMMLEADCLAVCGVWQGGIDCDSAVCEVAPTYACCLADGNCVEKTECQCGAAGGTFHADVQCESVSCPQPWACCLPDVTCVPMQEADCLAACGIWEDGINCSELECLARVFYACCLDDGSCVTTYECDCNVRGGAFHEFTECEPEVCPQPRACCLSETNCVMMFEADCLAICGIWDDRVDCLEAECLSSWPTFACCMPDGSCSEETDCDCATLGGLPQLESLCVEAKCD